MFNKAHFFSDVYEYTVVYLYIEYYSYCRRIKLKGS